MGKFSPKEQFEEEKNFRTIIKSSAIFNLGIVLQMQLLVTRVRKTGRIQLQSQVPDPTFRNLIMVFPPFILIICFFSMYSSLVYTLLMITFY